MRRSWPPRSSPLAMRSRPTTTTMLRSGANVSTVSEIVGPISEAAQSRVSEAVIAVGDNEDRRRIANALDLEWLTVVHPFTSIAPGVTLGRGTVAFAGTIVQPASTVGDHVILNSRAGVDHHVVVEDFVHVATAHLAGGTSAGQGSFLGLYSTHPARRSASANGRRSERARWCAWTSSPGRPCSAIRLARSSLLSPGPWSSPPGPEVLGLRRPDRTGCHRGIARPRAGSTRPARSWTRGSGTLTGRLQRRQVAASRHGPVLRPGRAWSLHRAR